MPYLLKFQIGPVQDFIAQARSTRDLWSGSYLLSWLVAAGIKALPQKGEELIFPSKRGQPLLEQPFNPKAIGILIPNLPNIFIAEVEGDATKIATDVKDAITDEWSDIAKSVWKKRDHFGMKQNACDRFFAQIERHLTISWVITPQHSDYKDAYKNNGWLLDAVKQTRDFIAWDSSSGQTHEKDSLSGKGEAVMNDSQASGAWKFLFKHRDDLSAVAVIKRVWHLAYLKEKHHLPTESDEFKIRSIPAIAAGVKELDDEGLPAEKVTGEKYIAAIAFDGDSIGKWVNGDNSPSNTDLRQHHADFSKALSDFALKRVVKIVEPEGEFLGQLIYAGGDDVVCLVPADKALEVAAKLRFAFRESTQKTQASEDKPDASAGIAIAHIHSPLQDLIREAQKAEKRAKNTVGRPAFSITLLKRSGEITHWGSKWDTGGIELYQEIATLMEENKLSGKFPHRVCQLLTPYLTQTSGLSRQQDAITDPATAKELIIREFAFASHRQGSKSIADQLQVTLSNYLNRLEPNTQTLLTSVMGLCTTLAFAHRTKPENSSSKADKQSNT